MMRRVRRSQVAGKRDQRAHLHLLPSSSSVETIDNKKKGARSRERASIIRRTPVEKPAFLSQKGGTSQVEKQSKNECAFLLTWLGLGCVILIQGLTLSASDFGMKFRDAITASWSWWWEGKNEKDELARAALTFFIVIIAVSWYFWVMTESKQTRLSLPPGPRALPIVGNLPFIDPEIHNYFAKLTNIYGPIFKLKLGTKLCVVIGSPDLAKEVLKDYDATFANRDTPVSCKVISYGLSGMAFSPYGPHWRMIRLLCVREILSKTSLDSLYTLRRVEVLRTVNNVYTKIGTPINIGEQIFPAMLNVLMRMLWSGTLEEDEAKSTGTTGSKFRLVIEEIIELLGKSNISDFFPVLARFDIQGIERRMKKLLLWIDQFFDSIIDQRMKFGQANENKDVLQVLLQLKDQADSKTPFSITNLKALFMELVIGGTDTSWVTVEWAMAELINNPEIMIKAQEELEVVVGRNNMVEESHLPKLNYLDAVVKETLRLHPGVPLLVRCPSLTCTVGGYTIPKGAQVFVNAWGIHRDPKNWDNPNDFQPERFLNCTGSNKWDNNGTNFRFIPFSSGRRKCVGVPLVERTVPYVLASLLHSFEWRVPEGTDQVDLTEKFGNVLKKATPLVAIPSPRLSESNLYF